MILVYLDPDILLFRPMVEVFDGLGAHNIVLIPHIMQPLQDGKEPSDLSIMKSGVYNLGFLGVRNDPEARALIAWWGERCYLHCRVDVAGHMFTDQRWMDLAPAFVPNPLILRHPGYDVAYWNLAHRRMEQDGDGAWLVNGDPLVFFHFSGISPEDPTVFSKHQNRFTRETLGPVTALCEFYRQRVIANGWKKPHGFATGSLRSPMAARSRTPCASGCGAPSTVDAWTPCRVWWWSRTSSISRTRKLPRKASQSHASCTSSG